MSSGQSKVSAFPKIGAFFLNEGRYSPAHSPEQYSGPVFIYPTILFNYRIQLSYPTILSELSMLCKLNELYWQYRHVIFGRQERKVQA